MATASTLNSVPNIASGLFFIGGSALIGTPPLSIRETAGATSVSVSPLSSLPNIATGLGLISGSVLIGTPPLSLSSSWTADTAAIPGPEAGHPGTGADNAGHVAQIALLNQFAMAHFKSAPGDSGGAALAGVTPEVNPIAIIAQHHP